MPIDLFTLSNGMVATFPCNFQYHLETILSAEIEVFLFLKNALCVFIVVWFLNTLQFYIPAYANKT